MPGIVGIVSREPSSDCERHVEQMLRATVHDEFYTSDTLSVPEIGLYVGWTRDSNVSAIAMPLHDRPSGTSVILAGELVPSDSALGVRYREIGARVLRDLNGCFAGLLIDYRQKRCLLFNDRYGIRRLFAHDGPKGFFFATEAKAILRVVPQTRSFDPTGLAEFLTCGATLGSQSLFTGIEILPGASRLEFSKDGSVDRGTYFTRDEWEDQDRLEISTFEDRVRAEFPAVTRKYASGSAPTALSLTGGIDSRMVIACLEKRPGELPCYTFGSMFRDTHDVRIAQAVAKECEQPHTVLPLDEEFLRSFPKYIEGAVYRSDGYMGLSGAAELFVNEMARRIAPVRLTGNWGSELLRGARAFKSIIPKTDYINDALRPNLEKAHSTFRSLSQVSPMSFVLFHQAPHQGFARLSIEQSTVTMRTPFLDNSLVELLYRRPIGFTNGTGLSVAVIADSRPELVRIPTDFGELGRGWVVRKAVRRLLREASFKLEYWANHGMPDLVASATRSSPWLVRPLIGRHKFQHYRMWLRDELSHYVGDVLRSGSMISDCLDSKRVGALVDEHLSGKRNNERDIDKALTITLAERLLLRRSS